MRNEVNEKIRKQVGAWGLTTIFRLTIIYTLGTYSIPILAPEPSKIQITVMVIVVVHSRFIVFCSLDKNFAQCSAYLGLACPTPGFVRLRG